MKNFILTGAAGYIAPRHMKAIKETGNNLIAAYDPNDSVGVIDSYFPEAEFFTEFEELAFYTNKARKTDSQVEYCSIAAPNHLHAAHINYALLNGMDAICEKPLVIDPESLQVIENAEKESGKKLFNILQLRHHPSLLKLKSEVESGTENKHDVDLTYITSRGKWYHKSWKSDVSKSGGIVANIGIHFFDMLVWIFGDIQNMKVHRMTHETASGIIELKKARVRWFLSLDINDVPQNIRSQGQRTYRSITVDTNEIEFSGGFTDLHTESYKNILSGKGFGVDVAKSSIYLVDQIRKSKISHLEGEYHPFLQKNR